MADFFKNDIDEILDLTQKHVESITNMWTNMFPKEICRENLRKLMEHANTFYKDLAEESLEKEQLIKNEINILIDEAAELRRLLNTVVELPDQEENVPLVTLQAKMDENLRELRSCLRKRRKQICELLLEQETLCDELGEQPRPLTDDPLPTSEDIEAFCFHLEELRTERATRMNQVSVLRREIKGYLKMLELDVQTERDKQLLNNRHIKLDNNTFEGLKYLQKFYGTQVEEVRERIDSMRTKVESLWERLQISPNTQNKFKRHTEYNQYTYDIFNAELQRCETLKSQNIRKILQQVRREIVELWDRTLKSEVERNRFSNFNNSCYNDDLLELHEMELNDLKQFYQSNIEIFELFEERKALWDRMLALEGKASDPGRYNNRGGQLLKEEKERKTIASKLPKIEQRITELVQEYERNEHHPFLVFGENILDVMANEWEKKHENKEKKNNARKNVQTSTQRKQPISTIRTPLSLRNVSDARLARTPSSVNLSVKPFTTTQKRKLNPSEKTNPAAKRSLYHALNSPNVFLKPGRVPSSTSKIKPPSKSEIKTKRVLATTIRRRSGRTSLSGKKRRSMNKTAIRNVGNSSYNTNITVSEENYETFQMCIETDKRSSVVDKRILTQEKARIARLPKPCLKRTLSKQNISSLTTNRNVATPHSPHPMASATLIHRKLTTKNLPIII